MDKINVGDVFSRICAKKGITQEDLGKRFNKSGASMSQHRVNNTFDVRLLIEAFPELDLNWMLRGEDPLDAIAREARSRGLRMILEPLPARPGPAEPPGEAEPP